MKSVIYDFETLGTNPSNSAVVSLAVLPFDSSVFSSGGYSYEELVDQATLIKFDVDDQVRNHNRTIDQSTLEWWGQQSPEARLQLEPSSSDIKLTELFDKLVDITCPADIERVYTRGNTFDPIFLGSILSNVNRLDPYSYWKIRDTRSVIEGMTLLNESIDNRFIVPGLEDSFVKHDAKHDVAMDVMRMQYLIQSID